ncbi:hypothetical protein H9P43_000085 [Blastocladiella emersonii ATCC 22665]|nr:hypothetical protein H9P43_000085 [Blastocladiella emersonii ATCC 22665]
MSSATPPSFIGTLSVHVVRARELGKRYNAKMPFKMFRMDPYAVVSLVQGDERRTQPCMAGGRTPSWEREAPMTFTVPAHARPVLQVDVRDSRAMGEDRILGRAAVPVAEVVRGKQTELLEWHPLVAVKDGSPAGEVCVKVFAQSPSSTSTAAATTATPTTAAPRPPAQTYMDQVAPVAQCPQDQLDVLAMPVPAPTDSMSPMGVLIAPPQILAAYPATIFLRRRRKCRCRGQ